MNCFNCGGRGKVPVVDKATGDVQDLPCPQCTPGVVHAWKASLGPRGGTHCGLHFKGDREHAFEFSRDWAKVTCSACMGQTGPLGFVGGAIEAYEGKPHAGGGIEQNPAPSMRDEVAARVVALREQGIITGPLPTVSVEREPQIVNQARVAVAMLNQLAGLDGALPLLWDLLATTALTQNRALDEYGFIIYDTHHDLGDRQPFSWAPQAAVEASQEERHPGHGHTRSELRAAAEEQAEKLKRAGVVLARGETVRCHRCGLPMTLSKDDRDRFWVCFNTDPTGMRPSCETATEAKACADAASAEWRAGAARRTVSMGGPATKAPTGDYATTAAPCWTRQLPGDPPAPTHPDPPPSNDGRPWTLRTTAVVQDHSSGYSWLLHTWSRKP